MQSSISLFNHIRLSTSRTITLVLKSLNSVSVGYLVQIQFWVWRWRQLVKWHVLDTTNMKHTSKLSFQLAFAFRKRTFFYLSGHSKRKWKCCPRLDDYMRSDTGYLLRRAHQISSKSMES